MPLVVHTESVGVAEQHAVALESCHWSQLPHGLLRVLEIWLYIRTDPPQIFFSIVTQYISAAKTYELYIRS
jgi:hypothetical protein